MLLVFPLPSGPASPHAWAHIVEVGTSWAEKTGGAFHLVAVETSEVAPEAPVKRFGPVVLIRRRPPESWVSVLRRAFTIAPSKWVVVASDVAAIRPDWIATALEALPECQAPLLLVRERSSGPAREASNCHPMAFASTRELAERALWRVARESASFPFANWLAEATSSVPPEQQPTVIWMPRPPDVSPVPAAREALPSIIDSPPRPSRTSATMVVQRYIRALLALPAASALLLFASIPRWLALLAAWTVFCTVVAATTLWLFAGLVLHHAPVVTVLRSIEPGDGVASRLRWGAFLCLGIGVGLAAACLPWADTAAFEAWQVAGLAGAATFTVLGTHAIAWSQIFSTLHPEPSESLSNNGAKFPARISHARIHSKPKER